MPRNETTALSLETRVKIARFLPKALSTALESYHEFCQMEIPDGAKGFSAHHSACKEAIAHIELLLKVAQYAHLPDDGVVGDDDQRRLVTMLETAQAEFNDYQDGLSENSKED